MIDYCLIYTLRFLEAVHLILLKDEPEKKKKDELLESKPL